MILYSFENGFDYENGFYLTAGVDRFSKFVSHYELFKMSMGKPGEIVECGVFKGVSLVRWIKFRALLENTYSRKVIGFDTFGKFPLGSEIDKKNRALFIDEAGDTSITKQELYKILEHHRLNDNVALVEGDVCSTIPDYLREVPNLRISLLHIDVDLYEATKISLELLLPRVVKGGVVILDDYGAFPGANKAIEEVLSDCDLLKLSFSRAITYFIK